MTLRQKVGGLGRRPSAVVAEFEQQVGRVLGYDGTGGHLRTIQPDGVGGGVETQLVFHPFLQIGVAFHLRVIGQAVGAAGHVQKTIAFRVIHHVVHIVEVVVSICVQHGGMPAVHRLVPLLQNIESGSFEGVGEIIRPVVLLEAAVYPNVVVAAHAGVESGGGRRGGRPETERIHEEDALRVGTQGDAGGVLRSLHE